MVTSGHRLMSRSTKILFLIVIAAVAARAIVLAVLGPIHFEDTDGHFNALGVLKADGYWPAAFDWTTDHWSTFRVLGYASLMGAVDAVLGFRYGAMTPNFLAVIALQNALSLAAGAVLFHTALKVTKSIRIAALACVIHLFSFQLLYDLVLLPDSMFNSLMLIAVCRTIDRTLAADHPTSAHALLIGLVLAGMLLLRETALWLTPAVAAFWAATSAFKRAGLARVAALALSVCMPVAVTYVTYCCWNLSRTGEWFLTTGGQYALLVPALRISQHAPDVRLLWDERLRATKDPIEVPTMFWRSKIIIEEMSKVHALTPPEATKLSSQAAMRSIAAHPLWFFYETAKQFSLWPAATVIGLPFVVDVFGAESGGPISRTRLQKHGTPITSIVFYLEGMWTPMSYLKLRRDRGENTALTALRAGAITASALILIAFVLGGLMSAVRLVARASAWIPSRQNRWYLCSALVLALYAYWAMLHCTLSFEVRYIIAMQSVAAAYGLHWLMCAAEAAEALGLPFKLVLFPMTARREGRQEHGAPLNDEPANAQYGRGDRR